jgi:hypothetical protein
MISNEFVQLIASDAVDSATTTIITAASHGARAGDIIRFTSGVNDVTEVSVLRTDTNTITIAQEVDTAPSALDTFDVLRYTKPLVSSTGALSVDIGFSLITYVVTRPTMTDTVSSVILAANAARKFGTRVQNNNAFPVFINIGAAAVQDQGLMLGASQLMEFNTTQAINGIQNSGGDIEVDVYEAT